MKHGPVVVALAVVMASFLAGTSVGPLIKEDYDAKREARAVYGVPPDTSKPWGPPACQILAGSVAKLQWAKRTGAKKSLVMAEISRSMVTRENAAEVLGELSRAWDADTDATEFLIGCLVDVARPAPQRERM